MSNELLACPFCGGQAELNRSAERFEYGVNGGPDSAMDYGYEAYCTQCNAGAHATNVPPSSPEEAAKDWNRRIIDKDIAEALFFAKSVILSGEPWTETCEQIIQGAINKAKGLGVEWNS